MAGLFEQSDYRCLSQLLGTLPLSTQEEIEALSVNEAKDRDLIPEACDETLRAFSSSEMKLYKHAMSHKWTVDELSMHWHYGVKRS